MFIIENKILHHRTFGVQVLSEKICFHSALALLITQLNPDILEFVFSSSFAIHSPSGNNLHTKSK